MAKVDIMLPFWGDVNLLKKAVLSVTGQTEQDWRLVILDDCYPSEEPLKFINSLGDTRIEYIRHKNNIGVTKNFNECIKLAKSEYCILIGCDDMLLPHYLSTALDAIGDADMYQPSVGVINKDGVSYLPLVDRVKRILRPKKSGIYQGEKLATSLSRGNWLYFPSIMWRTASLQRYRFNPNFKITQDILLELQLIIDNGVLYLDNNHKTFLYRRFSESLSSKEKKNGGVRFDEETAAYNHLASLFESRGWPKAKKAAQQQLISKIHRKISSFK